MFSSLEEAVNGAEGRLAVGIRLQAEGTEDNGGGRAMKSSLEPHAAQVNAAGEDALVEQRAREQLEQSGQYRGQFRDIRIESRQGVMHLNGHVPSFYLKQVLQTILRDVPGVQRIENGVQVTH